MNIVTSTVQFNLPSIIAFSNLKSKENVGELNYGHLQRGVYQGMPIISKSLDDLEGVEDIRDLDVGNEFYEVNIELDGEGLNRNYFYATTEVNAILLARAICKANKTRAYLHFDNVILAVVNELGDVTKSTKYSDVFLDVDPELDEYFDLMSNNT